MTSNEKTAFDGIRAEDRLKRDTLIYLRGQINKGRVRRDKAPLRRLSAVLACLLAVIAGVFSYNIYFTESAYVDLDVNPSIELAINRFDRVIGACAYNLDGETVLEGLNIRHKNYKDAVEIVIGAMARGGFISDYGLVSVTLQTDDTDKEDVMLSEVESVVLRHHGAARVDAFSIDSETRDAAHDVNLSPAKYLAILELQEVDPAATVESCREHSIGELKRMTDEHSAGGHHGGADASGSGGGNAAQDAYEDASDVPDTADIPDAADGGHAAQEQSHNGGGGHGNGHGGGHGKGHG